MKKNILTLCVSFTLTAITLISCSTKSSDSNSNIDPTPQLSFINGAEYLSHDTILKVATPIKIKIQASSNSSTKAQLNRFVTLRSFINKVDTIKDSTFSSSTFSYILVNSANPNQGMDVWKFVIIDHNNNRKEIQLNITTNL